MSRLLRWTTVIATTVAVAVVVFWLLVRILRRGWYALAFDANPLWCWAMASLAGVVVDLRWPHEASRRATT